MYAPNNRTSKYIKTKPEEADMNNIQIKNNSWKVQHPISATDRTTRHKINNYVEEKTQPIRSH